MSKKSTPKTGTVRYYFEHTRNYLGVVQAEVNFFTSLLEKKSELSKTNYTLHQAIGNAEQFLLDPKGKDLDICVDFDVHDPRSNEEQIIHLGTKLVPSKRTRVKRDAYEDSLPQVTYYLCLADKSSLFAKIHLDRDFDDKPKEKKPFSHIQSGGRTHPGLRRDNIRQVFWKDDIDKPRVPTLPVCSALLWHWAFLEYSEEEQIRSFIHAHWWKGLVKKAEEDVLIPFFEDGIHLMRHKPQIGLLNTFYNLSER